MKYILIPLIGLIGAFKPVSFEKRCTYEYINNKQCKKESLRLHEYCKKHSPEFNPKNK